MTEADLARLALAKRAYEATRPSEAEVSTGVRRARIALRRPKRRRAWISKGLVFVVLAIGSLAYAKPHALGEVVERVLQLAPAGRSGHANGRGAALWQTDDPSPEKPDVARSGSSASRDAREPSATAPSVAATGVQTPSAPAANASEPVPVVAAMEPATIAKSVTKKVPSARAATSAEAEKATAGSRAVSEWGRIGQALERGDEQAALAELGELSHSDDPRTRDKADLGRAQLMLSHGNRDDACALARSLIRRSAGERIERQAQALLSNCKR
jgi:hypothetical protein